MYCTTSPGYPLTSSTVYSPPPRPLPRNTFSRPAFSLKKPYKHCNWKCAALSAILISVTLLFLLAYFIGESPLILPHTRVWAHPRIRPSCILPLCCRHKVIECLFCSLNHPFKFVYLFIHAEFVSCFWVSVFKCFYTTKTPSLVPEFNLFVFFFGCQWVLLSS